MAPSHEQFKLREVSLRELFNRWYYVVEVEARDRAAAMFRAPGERLKIPVMMDGKAVSAVEWIKVDGHFEAP